MAAKTEGAPLSLRPMSLRPGGGTSKNPFERFAKGAGYAVKTKVSLLKRSKLLQPLAIARCP